MESNIPPDIMNSSLIISSPLFTVLYLLYELYEIEMIEQHN